MCEKGWVNRPVASRASSGLIRERPVFPKLLLPEVDPYRVRILENALC